MATYAEIAERVREHRGFVPETCWIAHVKADYGLTRGKAPNRHHEDGRRHPCPEAKREAIVSALRHFGMI